MTGRRVHRGRVLVAVTLACAGLCGCTGGRDEPVSITVSPGTALIDQPVRVSIRGLPARAVTTVTAAAEDAAGVTWSASADFRASKGGTLSLDQAPTGGAYTGANPMGLFLFMKPGDPDAADFSTPPGATASRCRRGSTERRWRPRWRPGRCHWPPG